MIQAPELTGVEMGNLFWLTDAQMERLKPFFQKSHGKPRVDDRRVVSGIIFINRNGLRWCDAPREYGPPKTLYRWKRWGDMGVFARIGYRPDAHALDQAADDLERLATDRRARESLGGAMTFRRYSCGRPECRRTGDGGRAASSCARSA